MSIIPPWEKIVETKTCLISWEEFHVTDKDLEFYDKVSPVFNGQKYAIPTPKLCPDERRRRRLSFRNEGKVYQRKCSATWNNMFSMFPEIKKFPVYSEGYYFWNEWSPCEYWISMDFDKTFFSVLEELVNVTPQNSRSISNSENSDYSNNAQDLKNCYLCFWGWLCEDLCYCTKMVKSQKSLDCTHITNSSNCYECLYVTDSYWCLFSQYLTNCSNCVFLEDSIWCKDCFGSKWLRNQQYVFLGEQLTREDYEKRLNEVQLDRHADKIKDIVRKSTLLTPNKNNFNIGNDSVLWEYLANVKSWFNCFDCANWENIRYCSDCYENTKNCMDVDFFWWWLEHSYESSVCGTGANIYFSTNCWAGVSDILYSLSCTSTKNLFWCCSLHNHEEYCILNKSYSRQEYETLSSKIIAHMISASEWGEGLPHEISLFWYNETLAQDYYPLIKHDALQMPKFQEWKDGKIVWESKWSGWNWHNTKTKALNRVVYIPKCIDQYDEWVVGKNVAKENIEACLNWMLTCSVTWAPFRIIKQELVFYIENQIPIPMKCPEQRRIERVNKKNPRKLYDRKCMCSACETPDVPMYTTYSPDRPETVYCEECYRKEVYS